MKAAPAGHERWGLIDASQARTLSPWLEAELEALRAAGGVACVAIQVHGAPVAAPALGDATLDRLARFELPTVAFFDAELVGDALNVALACDIRLCGPAASFVVDASAGAWTEERLRTLLGDGAALTRALSGERLDARGALQCGLVSELVAGDALAARAAALAATIASRGPIATRLAKEAVWRGLELPFANALRFEHDLTLLLQTTKDRSEGVRAFLEKRPPRFAGE